MIKGRPTLPIGFSLSGSPAIGKVLHTDSKWEIYRLDSSVEESSLLLLLARSNDEESARLREWWSGSLSPNVLAERIFDVSDVPGFTVAAVLHVQGHSLEGETFLDATQAVLRDLLANAIDLVAGGRSSAATPNLESAFVWQDMNGVLFALIPSDEEHRSEADAIRYVARSFYQLATGIRLSGRTEKPSPLSQWCKFAGSELSRIVDSCLETEGTRGRIETFAQLNSAIGRSIASSPSQDLPNSRADDLPQKRKHGLEKVAGMHQLKELLQSEVVEPVRNPEPFRRYGLSIPNGILLYGPPGCGKTYIARALAEELGHYFVEIVPSELASPYVHGSVIRIRELFDDAAEHAPAVVFIDEFEALVPTRTGLGGFQHHKAEEVNELLTHLNGSSEKRIFVVAATNQPEMIDPAVRRTGRLDKLIYVGAPDTEARREMLALHLSGRPLAPDLALQVLAIALAGYSASDLSFLVDEAARDALAKRADISAESFQIAMSKVRPSIPPEVEAQYQSIEQRGL